MLFLHRGRRDFGIDSLICSLVQGRPIVRPEFHPRAGSSRFTVSMSRRRRFYWSVTEPRSLPVRRAQAAGWPCIVLSDMLTVRGYSDLAFSKPKAPRPAPATTTAAAADAAGVPPQPQAVPGPSMPSAPERAEGIVSPSPSFTPMTLLCDDTNGRLPSTKTDEQQSLVLQLQQVTSLNYQFAHMCLAQNGWDPHQALSQFQTLHAQGAIPPEAFAHQQQVVQPAA